MPIQTLAKGVYIVQPKLEGSRAADYMERYTRAMYQQTEMAMQQAASEVKSAQDKYKLEVELYKERLKSLQARQAELIDQYQKQNWSIEEYNAKSKDATEKERIAAQNKRDELRAQSKVSRTSTTSVKEAPPPKAGAATGAGKLTRAQQGLITQGLAATGYDTDSIEGVIKGLQLDGKLGGSPQQIDAARSYALDSLRGQGLSESDLKQYVQPEILQSDARHKSTTGATPGLRPGGDLQETTSATRYEYYRPYSGLPREVIAREFVPREGVDVTQDPEYQKIAREIESLNLPQQEKIDLLERTRQLREERFNAPILGRAKPSTGTDSILAQFSLLPPDQQAKIFESFKAQQSKRPAPPVPSPASPGAVSMETPTPKGGAPESGKESPQAKALIARLNEAGMIARDEKKFESLSQSELGKLVRGMVTADKTSNKPFAETYRNLSKHYATSPTEREEALKYALAIDIRNKIDSSPAIYDTIKPSDISVPRREQPDMTEKTDLGSTTTEK